MSVRRNKSNRSRAGAKAKAKAKPTTIRKAKNIAETVDQRINTYKGHIISFSELNQSNDVEREKAIYDFVQAMIGKVETQRQGRYADVIDTVPILGDIAQLFIIGRTELEYQKYQIGDFLIGLVPIIGDIADYLFTPNTNKKVAEMRLRQEYYNSLIALNKINEANAYMLQVQSEGHELRSPKKKELDILVGMKDEPFKKLDEWEDEKISKVADTWSKFGLFGWRKLVGKGERIGADDKVQINPKQIGDGLAKVQKGAKVIATTDISKEGLKKRAKEEAEKKIAEKTGIDPSKLSKEGLKSIAKEKAGQKIAEKTGIDPTKISKDGIKQMAKDKAQAEIDKKKDEGKQAVAGFIQENRG